MKQQNNTQDSPERWVPVQYIKSSSEILVYPNYMVSDHGRVASMKGNVMKIRKPIPYDKLGHLQVHLYRNCEGIGRQIHRIVLSSFCPEQYFKGAEPDHIDRDPTNNHLKNLRWVSHNENDANRARNPLKKIRVTWLNDRHTETFNNMQDVCRAFGKGIRWCAKILYKFNGYNAKYNILIEKIG